MIAMRMTEAQTQLSELLGKGTRRRGSQALVALLDDRLEITMEVVYTDTDAINERGVDPVFPHQVSNGIKGEIGLRGIAATELAV